MSPLVADCLFCGSKIGQRCTRPDGRSTARHAARVAEAEALVRRARLLVARLGGRLVRFKDDGSFVVRVSPLEPAELVAVDVAAGRRIYGRRAA